MRGFICSNGKQEKLQQIIIDQYNHVSVLGGDRVGITVDKEGNVWGLTKKESNLEL